MTLKNLYEKTKCNKIKVPSLTIALCIVGFYIYLIYAGWHNIISKVFNLPDITYIQMVGIIFWVMLIKIFLDIITIKQGYKNDKRT